MSKFKDKIKKQYEKDGYIVLSLVRVGVAGFADLLCLKDGKSIFIEIKEKNDTLKPLQKYRIDQLREQNFEAFCLKDGEGIIYP